MFIVYHPSQFSELCRWIFTFSSGAGFLGVLPCCDWYHRCRNHGPKAGSAADTWRSCGFTIYTIPGQSAAHAAVHVQSTLLPAVFAFSTAIGATVSTIPAALVSAVSAISAAIRATVSVSGVSPFCWWPIKLRVAQILMDSLGSGSTGKMAGQSNLPCVTICLVIPA